MCIWSRLDSRWSQFILFFQRFTILVSGRYFCDPLVLGQKEISDQSQGRDGAVLANEERVFSDPWLTAPRRPERSIICQSQYQEQPDLYRTRERERSGEATTTTNTPLRHESWHFCSSNVFYIILLLFFFFLSIRIMFHFHSFICQHLSAEYLVLLEEWV